MEHVDINMGRNIFIYCFKFFISLVKEHSRKKNLTLNLKSFKHFTPFLFFENVMHERLRKLKIHKMKNQLCFLHLTIPFPFLGSITIINVLYILPQKMYVYTSIFLCLLVTQNISMIHKLLLILIFFLLDNIHSRLCPIGS